MVILGKIHSLCTLVTQKSSDFSQKRGLFNMIDFLKHTGKYSYEMYSGGFTLKELENSHIRLVLFDSIKISCQKLNVPKYRHSFHSLFWNGTPIKKNTVVVINSCPWLYDTK